MQDTTQRSNLDAYAVFILAVIGFIFAILWNYQHPHLVVRYDCSIAEISPDYPIEVREGCRKLRADNIKENLQKPK
jgi:hypothetical protein